MNIFRKPEKADSTGDAIPFYHDNTYHIFSLTPPVGTTVYPARLRTAWNHTISTDLVNWKEMPVAIHPGEGDEPDASGVWTGAVIYGEGKYHAFYTGYNIQAEYQQTICRATSTDSITWEKDPKNPIILPLTSEYEPLDWRDPYVFYNEDESCYWMLISARINKGPVTRRGCVVLYRSPDLENWEHYGPIYEPWHTNCPECSEMYKIGDVWYLSYSRFSEFVNTIYRTSYSPYGPWRTPRFDGIGGRRFYAAKSLENAEGRRFYFGWAHDRGEESDKGEWYWGGAFCIPHEVKQNPEGELDVFLPLEYEQSISTPVPWKFEKILGDIKQVGENNFSVSSEGTFSYGFFDQKESSFKFSCSVVPRDVTDHFGLLLKSDKDASVCLQLVFDPAMQRVSLENLPMAVDPFWQQSCQSIPAPKDPGPDGFRVCEKPFGIQTGEKIDITVIIDNDMIEIFVGDKATFTYRSYASPDYEVGLFVQDGDANFYNVTINK